jgi:hypothetical protein
MRSLYVGSGDRPGTDSISFPPDKCFAKDEGGVSSPEDLIAKSDAQSGGIVVTVFLDPGLVKVVWGIPDVESEEVASDSLHPFNFFSVFICVPIHNDHEASVKLLIIHKSLKASFISYSF